MPAQFRDRVVQAIRRLEPGQVASYGDIAAEAGYPGAARGVGSVLAHSDGLPWWRVVRADGRLVPGKEAEQGRLLRAEQVAMANGRVLLDRRSRTSPVSRSRVSRSPSSVPGDGRTA